MVLNVKKSEKKIIITQAKLHRASDFPYQLN